MYFILYLRNNIYFCVGYTEGVTGEESLTFTLMAPIFSLFNHSFYEKASYALFLFLMVSLAQAQMVEVVFAVNMNDVTDFNPAGGVFVAGAFQSWTPSAGALADEDGNGVWHRSYMLAPGTYQYKFGIGSDWGNNEGGGLADCGVDDGNGAFNREIVVPEGGSSMVVNFLYNSCTESDTPLNIRNLSTLSGVEVIPNPMVEQAIIRFANPTNAAHDIWVSNMAGQVVRQFDGVRGTQVAIQRAGLSSGLYFVTFRNERGERGSLKLMIQ